MRVLHLPFNIASQISITVRALRDLGVDARGLVVQDSVLQGNEAVDILPLIRIKEHPLQGTRALLRKWQRLGSAIAWADMVHWHYGGHTLPRLADLRYTAMLGKPRLVEFWGSDIRIPEIASADNPYLQRMMASPGNTYGISLDRSRNCQATFARFGFACLIPGPELLEYVQHDLFPEPFRAEGGLILSDYEPAYPDPTRRRPVVAHSPSNPALKGTNAVLAAVERLKGHYDFEFQLIHQVPHADALQMVRRCDVVLDQFVVGSFGTVSVEAMAFGKPAVCYVRPSVLAKLPSNLPIVLAEQDNLADVLGRLLEDGRRRMEIGQQSRAYVEEHHDAHKIARHLVATYQELLDRSRRLNRERRQTH